MSNPKPLDSDQRAAHKGQQTKATIVEAALGLATQIGLEGLSIGALAEVARMSKSGVFAHFGSREELQLSVVHLQKVDLVCVQLFQLILKYLIF